jgi:hypothetical protein
MTSQAKSAAGTNTHFSHEETTRAPPSAIWRLWMDLSTWPDWDPETEYARADGPLAPGLSGAIKGRGAPESRFVVTRLDPGQSYEFSTELPLGGRLIIFRQLVSDGALTRFKHDVRFEGFGGWLFSPFFGPKYREALPGVLERIKRRAEEVQP